MIFGSDCFQSKVWAAEEAKPQKEPSFSVVTQGISEKTETIENTKFYLG
jgi:hypothetical protein